MDKTKILYVGEVRDYEKFYAVLEENPLDEKQYDQMNPLQNMCFFSQNIFYLIIQITRKNKVIFEVEFSNELDYSSELWDKQWAYKLLNKIDNE